jgi:NADH-quinone oxidoreductase subunit F
MNVSKNIITVGLGSCGIAAGGEDVFQEILSKLKESGIKAEVNSTGCCGMCHREVIVEISTPESGSCFYGDIDVLKVGKIVEEHLLNNKPVEEWLIAPVGKDIEEAPYFKKQKRIVLRNCGKINPENIDHYIANKGFKALEQCLNKMQPQDVIDEIRISGLRGRGGAGFSTGMKWQFAHDAKGNPKYIVCNADEGDPGAFMDRSVLEGDPYSVLEGMLIGAYAIGSTEGYIYCRAEYPLAIHRLNLAIKSMTERGYLGDRIMGKNFSLKLKIKEGAGAFVCGEETALLGSIEGERGMPKLRPPFPAQSGLWKKPTNINNVETFANIPWIIVNGANAFNSLGTEKSKGSKVFALAGRIKNGGLVEVPMGITIREVIEDIGGGTSTNRPIKAAQLGGPSGGCIPASLFDTIVDYDSVNATGAIMGSGGMVVMDESSCMVDIARFFLNFTQDESCGKCTFCRIGTKRMLEILTRITEGKGVIEDLDKLEELSEEIKTNSLCGLGQTAPNPVLTTLKYFRSEYEAHIIEKRCPALSCKALIRFEIQEDNCIGCTLCKRACPVEAISGVKKEVHLIDDKKCIRCGLCVDKCKFNAIAIR